MRNAETDVQANISTDHYPLMVELQVRLKAQEKKKLVDRKKYLKCSKEQRELYNIRLGGVVQDNGDYSQLISRMQTAAEGVIPLEIKGHRGDTISQTTLDLLEQRGKRRAEGNFDDDEPWTKEIKKSKRQDKRAEILRTLSEDLGDREQWMGIKQLRKQYQPIPYSSRDKLGRHIEMKDRAEEAARFLAEEIWGLPGVERSSREERWPIDRYPRLVNDPLGISTGEITLKELRAAIRKLKRRKSRDQTRCPWSYIRKWRMTTWRG